MKTILLAMLLASSVARSGVSPSETNIAYFSAVLLEVDSDLLYYNNRLSEKQSENMVDCYKKSIAYEYPYGYENYVFDDKPETEVYVREKATSVRSKLKYLMAMCYKASKVLY